MNRITDELLYKYVPIVDEMLVKEIEENTDYEYEFSDIFKIKMKKLIFEEKHQKLSKIIKSPLRMIASIVIVVFLSLFTVTMSVEAYRIEFFAKVKSIFEDSFVYKYYVEEDSEGIIYEPKYIVEGYELIRHDENDITSIYEYYNYKTDQQYNLTQELVTDGKNVVFDLEYDSLEKIEIGEFNIDIYRYEDGYIRAYLEFGQSVFIVEADNLSEEEIKKIIVNWIK